MSDKKCETDCREDLIEKIDNRVSKTSLFKITSIIISIILALWGIGYNISSKDVQRREISIQKNTDTINKTREEMVKISTALDSIKYSQQVILRELRSGPRDNHNDTR